MNKSGIDVCELGGMMQLRDSGNGKSTVDDGFFKHYRLLCNPRYFHEYSDF
jgi:hypothetical protein